jgi:hypothetical protein
MQVQTRWILALAVAVALAEALPGQTQASSAPAQQSTGWRSVSEQPSADPAPPAGSLTLPAGTWIKVRTDQVLSSDHNQAGDGFTATLMEPLVADGFVVARRGQTIAGRVVEAEKAPRGKGSSRLALEIAELTLVDGHQMPIRTSLAEYEAGRSVGRNVTTVATTTGLGAAIGAVAEGGFGAGIGAAAGAAAGTFGVLLTRGRPTVVYPEAQLTFRLVAPLTVSTQDSPAYQPVTQADYGQGNLQPRRAATQPPPYPYYYGYGGYYDPFIYPGFYPGFYYGPGFFFSGPRGHFSRGFVGGRFGRR